MMLNLPSQPMVGSFVGRILGDSVNTALQMGQIRQQQQMALLHRVAMLPSPVLTAPPNDSGEFNEGFSVDDTPPVQEGFSTQTYIPRTLVTKAPDAMPVQEGFSRPEGGPSRLVTRELSDEEKMPTLMANTRPQDFKTAEEYVASKGPIVFHGGGKAIDSFDNASPNRGALGAAYFTDSRDVAEKYAYGGGIDNTKTLEEYKHAQKELRPNRNPTVTEAIVDIHNPLTEHGALWNEILDTLGAEKIANALSEWSPSTYEDIQRFSNEDGYADEIDWIEDTWSAIKKMITEGAFSGTDTEALAYSPGINFLLSSGLLEDFMKARQHDGIIIDDAESGGRTIIPRTAEQIRTKPQLTAEWEAARGNK